MGGRAEKVAQTAGQREAFESFDFDKNASARGTSRLGGYRATTTRVVVMHHGGPQCRRG